MSQLAGVVGGARPSRVGQGRAFSGGPPHASTNEGRGKGWGSVSQTPLSLRKLHARRCAGAPATRRSCGRRRGGDGAVETRRGHQTDCHVSESSVHDSGFRSGARYKVTFRRAPPRALYRQNQRRYPSGRPRTRTPLWSPPTGPIYQRMQHLIGARP